MPTNTKLPRGLKSLLKMLAEVCTEAEAKPGEYTGKIWLNDEDIEKARRICRTLGIKYNADTY